MLGRMSIANPPKNKKIMALDIGTKTIGVALSDRSHMIATPFRLIERSAWKNDLAALKSVIAAEQVGAIVLGLPRNMDGTEGPRAQSIRQFARNLNKDHDLAEIQCHFWDERLSTAAVERDMIDRDISRAKRAETIDMAAAAYILEGFLAYLKGQNPED